MIGMKLASTDFAARRELVATTVTVYDVGSWGCRREDEGRNLAFQPSGLLPNFAPRWKIETNGDLTGRALSNRQIESKEGAQ